MLNGRRGVQSLVSNVTLTVKAMESASDRSESSKGKGTEKLFSFSEAFVMAPEGVDDCVLSIVTPPLLLKAAHSADSVGAAAENKCPPTAPEAAIVLDHYDASKMACSFLKKKLQLHK